MKCDEMQIGGSHYINKAVQPWEAMQAWMTEEQFKGFLIGNAIKYLARLGDKEDASTQVKKARHYLDKYLELSQEAYLKSDAYIAKVDKVTKVDTHIKSDAYVAKVTK